MGSISTIRNLGPATERDCNRAGIHSAEDLQALGPDVAYARMLDAGIRPHFIAYYALVMALQGRPWSDCKGAEKGALRQRFDALKAHRASHSQIEASLNLVGTGLRRAPGLPFRD